MQNMGDNPKKKKSFIPQTLSALRYTSDNKKKNKEKKANHTKPIEVKVPKPHKIENQPEGF